MSEGMKTSHTKERWMDVIQAINERRAYRSLESVDITEDLIKDLAQHARLAPSCFNNQPWRFVFVRDPEMLEKMHEALSQGNVWARAASMIIAVFSKKEDDCIIRDREYHQFDCGLAAGFLVLRATELGLVAHPIAGYSPKKTREILGIPEDYQVITLIIVGKHSEKISSILTDDQVEAERSRPERRPFSEIVSIDRFGQKSIKGTNE
jgi:nitroreductase